MSQPWLNELEFLRKIVKQQGDLAYHDWFNPRVIEQKKGSDFTTDKDKSIELLFQQQALELFPQYGFKGEELPELETKLEYNWWLDPIDGTKYYARQIPLWCVTAALVNDQSQAVVGVIYNPVSNQMYTAVRGQGAYLAEKKLSIENQSVVLPSNLNSDKIICLDLADWVLPTTSISHLFESLVKKYSRVRMLGSGGLGLAWLTQGAFSAYIDPARSNAKEIDVAAGLLIAEEAGFRIKSYQRSNGQMARVVASPELVEELGQLLESSLDN